MLADTEPEEPQPEPMRRSDRLLLIGGIAWLVLFWALARLMRLSAI
jgi:hypothetical protein